MPGIGALVLRNGILAVKFNESFSEKVKSQPQKLFETKKNVSLYMNTNTEEGKRMTRFQETATKVNLAKSLTNIRPKS